jgi:hypothetical protein
MVVSANAFVHGHNDEDSKLLMFASDGDSAVVQEAGPWLCWYSLSKCRCCIGLTDSSLIWMGELIARVNEKTQNNGEGEEEEQMLQIEKSISLCFYL